MKRDFNIAFIDFLSSPYNGDTINNEGMGGSEAALLCMAEELAKLGCNITVYNSCTPGKFNGVEYLHINKIEEEERKFDILIVSKSILPYIPQDYREQVMTMVSFDIKPYQKIVANSTHKIIWLHNEVMKFENLLEPLLLDGKINELFLLSDWHTNFFTQSSGKKFEQLKRFVFQTRNGIRTYPQTIGIKDKDPNLFIFNSALHKGLVPLLQDIWPSIYNAAPEAKLEVIGGYYLNNKTLIQLETNYKILKNNYDGKMNIHFTGIIPQKQVADILSRATFMIYPPSTMPETYCISILEAMNYNVIPITSRFGALEETAIEEVSYLNDYNVYADKTQIERFFRLAMFAYQDKEGIKIKQLACEPIKKWLTWDTVAIEWLAHFNYVFGEETDEDFYWKSREITRNIHRIFKRRNINPEYFNINRSIEKWKMDMD